MGKVALSQGPPMQSGQNAAVATVANTDNIDTNLQEAVRQSMDMLAPDLFAAPGNVGGVHTSNRLPRPRP